MPDTNKPEDSLATGVQATHIGPETGSTGSTTMGGPSGSGVSHEANPAPSNQTRQTQQPEHAGDGQSSQEGRSFVQDRTDATDLGGETSDAVKRSSDGKEQRTDPAG
jgi:hypothetical protein